MCKSFLCVLYKANSSYTCIRLTSNFNIKQFQSKHISSDNLLKMYHLNYRMRKPTICIGENKGADQLRNYCEADQRLCAIPLLSKIQNFQPLTIFCDCTARFVSDLVGKRSFSHVCWKIDTPALCFTRLLVIVVYSIQSSRHYMLVVFVLGITNHVL